MYEFLVDGEGIRLEFDRVYNAGYSGRDEEAVQAHIDELVDEGIECPSEIPALFELAPYTTLIDPGRIRVVGPETSGEAEFALLRAGGSTYVAAASDHTDRNLETESIQKSKQIAPNVLSRRVWRLKDIRDHWDEIELRSWNWIDGERTLYQNTKLATLLRPREIVETVRERHAFRLQGVAILSGTVATVSGDIVPGSAFEVELHDPIQETSLSVSYDIDVI